MIPMLGLVDNVHMDREIRKDRSQRERERERPQGFGEGGASCKKMTDGGMRIFMTA